MTTTADSTAARSVEAAASAAKAGLPEVLARIAEATSAGVALKLAEDFGGTEVYVPQVPSPHSALVRSVGQTAAGAVAGLYGGEKILVPVGPKADHLRRRAAIRRLLGEGQSVYEVARALGCHERTVRRART